MTHCGEEPIKYDKSLKDCHITAALETHLRGEAATMPVMEMKFAGGRAFHEQATMYSSSSTGSHGGAMLCHRPYLTSACPAEAEGTDGSTMPEGNIIWKHFRIEGMPMTICVA